MNLHFTGNDIVFMWSLGLIYTLVRTHTFNIRKDTSIIVTAICVSSLVNKFMGNMSCIYIIVAAATYMVIRNSIQTKDHDICLKKGTCEWKEVRNVRKS